MLSSLRGTTMSGECPFRSFYVGAAISRPLLEKPELLEQRADNIRPYMASSRIDKMRIRTLPFPARSLPPAIFLL